jgi:hypothetical protein
LAGPALYLPTTIDRLFGKPSLSQHRRRAVISRAELAEKVTSYMQIVVALVVIWLLFVVLSWLLHAVKLLLVIAIIASLGAVAAKYLWQIIR